MSWSKSKNEPYHYSAFASDIESFKKNTGHGPRCPICRKELKMSFLFKHPVAYGEESHAMFKNTHSCGARITVFND
jgi:hypothetical protein